jgi:hypothetical protein
MSMIKLSKIKIEIKKFPFVVSPMFIRDIFFSLCSIICDYKPLRTISQAEELAKLEASFCTGRHKYRNKKLWEELIACPNDTTCI